MAEYPALPIYTDALMGDTTHLSAAEFGAYLLMLLVAWRSPDCSLPNDPTYLSRITRTHNNWGRISKSVMPFWQVCEDGQLRQKRLTQTRGRVSELTAQRKDAGRSSALKRLGSPATSVAVSSQQTANKIQLTKTKSKTIKDSIEKFRTEFEEWYSIYPRHEGRKKAQETHASILANGIATHEQLIAGARAYRAAMAAADNGQKFIKHPTTWLNGNHWEDLFGMVPTASPPHTAINLSRDEWHATIKRFLVDGFWISTEKGPNPCDEDCQAPPDLIARAATVWAANGNHPLKNPDGDDWTRHSVYWPVPKPFWSGNVVQLRLGDGRV